MRQQSHLKCRLFLLLALFFISSASFAREWYFNEHTFVSKYPTAEAPYVEITFNFFDASGEDSYFDGAAPVLTLDGSNLVTLTELEKCNGENETGGAKWLENQAKGSWLPQTYTASRNGVNYRIRLYNPHRGTDGSAFYTTVVIVPDKINLTEKHTYGITGLWRHNRKKGYTTQRTWNSGEIGFTEFPKITMNVLGEKNRPAYNKFETEITFNEKIGDTTVGTNGESVNSSQMPTQYINPSNLKSHVTVEKGTAKRKITHNRLYGIRIQRYLGSGVIYGKSKRE